MGLLIAISSYTLSVSAMEWTGIDLLNLIIGLVYLKRHK
ncbi:hypothetical protein SK110_0625 [Lactococcus cremoris]|nr:hypothetical protein SK110_0625 [Lactococcus cremoris]